ncbi:hypothetical protein FOZ61_003902 [Perkinsus olseni]|uniref:Uncharacterized protein n=1 Tax=Perkinsus olseni TaxID=32597 RepID=A0A7J6LMU3_PEROL|nr:hypothetical protein FOL46_009321 [Perkinsus olseni]KAF4660584.1 hypothetical protein FOZ61_003902 [Perkinsus olseni]
MSSHSVTNRNTENCSKLAAYSSVALRRLRQNAVAGGGGVNTIEQFLDTLLEYSKALHILPPTVELKDDALKHIRVEYYPPQAREALDLIRDRVAEPDVTESLKRWATAAANSMCSSQGNSEASVTVEQQLLITELFIEVAGSVAAVQDVLISALIDCLMAHTDVDSDLGKQLATGRTALVCESLLALSRAVYQLIHLAVDNSRLCSQEAEPAWIHQLVKLKTRLVAYRQDFPAAPGLLLLAVPLSGAIEHIDNCRNEAVKSIIADRKKGRLRWVVPSQDHGISHALSDHATRLLNSLQIGHD